MILVIVESPTKAKKIQKYLGDGYVVKSSQGHFIELDTKNLDKMINNNFTPIYKLMSSKKKIISDLKSTKTKKIILAADDDREGDAIAWHCGNLLKIDFNKKNRITFNEISKSALEKAIKNPKKINLNSVNAQRSRQLIDLIIGFKLSPLLWKHIETNVRGLSAGRVQSCLLRILVDHENDIKNFKSTKSYKITGDFNVCQENFECNFKTSDNLSDDYIKQLFDELHKNRTFYIKNTTNKKESVKPQPPFITTTLQIAAQSELGFSVKQTDSIAQKLFENGKITYIRTDSTFIAEDFSKKIKLNVIENFGEEYYKEFYSNKKVKGAQEAHECIRPTDLNCKLNDGYTDFDKKLYNLILKRTIISNMKPAIYDTYQYILSNKNIKQGDFIGKHRFLEFLGYLIYSGKNETQPSNPFKKNQKCELLECISKNVESNPPQYLNETSIIKKLESSGIGRPSTYASIISTLYNRNYTIIKDIPEKTKKLETIILTRQGTVDNDLQQVKIPKQSKKVMVTDLGKIVLDYLLKHFSMIINVDFTASVESDLDKVSSGNMNFNLLIKKIYDSFIDIVIQQKQIKMSEKQQTIINGYILKNGNYGQYLHDTKTKRNYNVSNYVKYYKKDVDNLTEKDVLLITKYPLKIGKYKNKDVTIYLGPKGFYVKNDNKTVSIKSPEITIESCKKLLK